MQRAAVFIFVIVLALVMLPFAFGVCAFRVDSFYYLKGGPEVTSGPLVMSFNAIKCYDGGQRNSIPGALAPNEKANGFQVTWKLKGEGEYKQKLTVENIKAELINGSETKPLDVPFSYWPGEFNSSKNGFYAFISTGDTPSELPLGAYHVRLSYIANGNPTMLT